MSSTDFVVIGRTAESGRWDTDVEPEVSRRILENCSKIMGSVKVIISQVSLTVVTMTDVLQNATVLGEWSGLRPHRKTGVRLERELMRLDSSQQPLEVCGLCVVSSLSFDNTFSRLFTTMVTVVLG